MSVIVVRATWDDQAGVWTTESPDVHGLRIEAETFDILMHRLPGAILDLLEDGDDEATGVDVPIEVIASASTRVRVPEHA